MDGTWLTVAIILMVIGLIIVGYFYDSDDGPLVALEGVVVIGMCLFWPVVFLFIGGCCIIAVPILLGYWVKKSKEKRKKKREEEFAKLNKADAIKKSKIC